MRHSRILACCLTVLVLAPLSACELVADFDRSKIPAGKTDAGPLVVDATTVDDEADASSEDDAGER